MQRYNKQSNAISFQPLKDIKRRIRNYKNFCNIKRIVYLCKVF